MFSWLPWSSKVADDVPDSQRHSAFLKRFEDIRDKSNWAQVPEISGAELKDLPRDSYILVDVRSEAERNVSMIPGSITKEEFEKRFDELKDQDIVVYCAIGGRSGTYCKQLLATHPGLKVRNYAGSIIDWLHVPGALVDHEGKSTNKIHPGGSTWKQYVPAAGNYIIVT
ncbi:hypothetical protein KFL_004860060 [Klebsormidium nitens]|uniref:Rhodanese domain-containing protein n=1 Tax=Klebsormidium nitens TaxID=105231 RepID=A0A1Y1ILV3_KLENI|nr:hypothetical protein KFL_004860060 [Klebsormidium nitens]|eukprot:GAQ89088.1 hypothetical protein KFL_004860060 [Klebsormidium nitens]